MRFLGEEVFWTHVVLVLVTRRKTRERKLAKNLGINVRLTWNVLGAPLPYPPLDVSVRLTRMCKRMVFIHVLYTPLGGKPPYVQSCFQRRESISHLWKVYTLSISS